MDNKKEIKTGIIGGGGEYRVILVKDDNTKTLGGFDFKDDAIMFAKGQAPNYTKADGLLCLIWQGKDGKKTFFDIYN
jgi:hypothetical protein